MKTEFDEKSCGAVLYQRRNGQLRYLIARSSSGHVSFSKGHMEEDETEWETAVREIREETGIARLRKTGDFRERFCCLTEKGKHFAQEKIYPLYEIENRIWSEWTEEEQQQYIALTKKYRDALKRYMETML